MKLYRQPGHAPPRGSGEPLGLGAGARFFGRILLLGLLAMGLDGTLRAQNAEAPVRVETAERRLMAPVSWYPGTVTSRWDSRVAAGRSGRLIWVAEVGTRVEAQETLARLDNELLESDLAARQAAVARERARQTFFSRELARLERLKRSDYANQSRLDEVRRDLSVSRSELASARAGVREVEELLKRSRVVAPFAGVVTERLVQAGEWAQEGKALVRLVDDQRLEVRTWVPADSLPLIRVGDQLQFRAGERYGRGEVSTLVPVGDEASRLYQVRLKLESLAWPAGLDVRVAVPSAPARQVTAVPRDALVLRREGSSVFRIRDDQTAERVAVVPGVATGPYIEVAGEIQPGDRVVVRGGERLRPGQKVRILTGSETL